MKENKYDETIFFEKYSKMNRSMYGLEGSGEWSELKKLLPDFKGKKVLDLGCGYGWHCIYAAKQGADSILGTDISHKMLEVAKQKTSSPIITYQCSAMEDLKLESKTYDIIISSLAFHYIEDFPALVKHIYQWLTAGGRFIFSVEHPVFTAYGTQDWFYDESGEILHFPVDNYYYEGIRDANFLGEHITKYHRTLTTYLNTLLTTGFTINQVVEPQPPESMIDLPGMKDEMRRPMMLLVSATK